MNKYKLEKICYITNGKGDVKDSSNKGLYPFFDRSTEIKYVDEPLFDNEAIIYAGEGAEFYPRYYKGKYGLHQRCYTICDFDEKIVNPKYLYYKLFLYNKYFQNASVGTTVPSLRLNHFTDLEIDLPLLEEQIKISDFLSKLDYKIALNKKIIKELEDLAKTIYDYWFMQYEFPNEEGKPYKSSGGKIVWNEVLKREIPDGWSNGILSDVVNNISESTESGEHLKGLDYTPIEKLEKKRMTFGSGFDYTEANSSLILYKKFDILIGAMRVYFHRVCIAPFDGITRTTTIVLRPKNPKHLPFIYQTIFDDTTIEFATRNSVGTQQPYVKWEGTLENYKIAIPQSDIIEKYCEKVMSMIDLVIKKELENNELINVRDWLLPMLMNGQVSFK